MNLFFLFICAYGFEFVDQTCNYFTIREFFGDKIGIKLPFYTETGYIELNSKPQTINKLFYHLILKNGTQQLADVSDQDSFAVWLQGGPGCTSQIGNYDEIGPFVINFENNLDIQLREYSWNNITHQIFIDQPFNTGLSYSNSSSFVTNSEQAGEYFVEFMKLFYQNRPQFSRTKFYIFGESFAGHFIPVFATQLLKSNIAINFAGIAIGDGWTNPLKQVAFYGSYLYTIGVVDNYRRDLTQQYQTQSQKYILSNEYSKATSIFDFIAGQDYLSKFSGGMIEYNYQKYLPQPKNYYLKFLEQYRTQFKVPNEIKIQECNPDLYVGFYDDLAKSKQKEIEFLLYQGIKILIYNGQLDYIVNTAGQQSWINQIKWMGIDGWKKQPKQILKALNLKTGNFEPAGWAKKYNNFNFVQLYRAGHMAPSDNPSAAYAMIDDFINS